MIHIDPANPGHHITDTYDINIFGGVAPPGVPVDETESYAIDHGVWSTKASMLGGGRYSMGVSSSETSSYIYGGIGASPPPTTYQYSSIGDLWIRKSNIPLEAGDEAFSWRAATILGDGYLFGGESDPSGGTNHTYKYTYAQDLWEQKTDFIVERYGHCAAAIGQKGYIYGGLSGVAAERELEEYSAAFDTWANKANMLDDMFFGAGCSVEEKLFSFGGSYDPDEVMEYDATGDAWSIKTDMPLVSINDRAVQFNSDVYLIGSLDGMPNPSFPTLYKYNVGLDSWLNMDNDFLYPRQRFGATVSLG